MGSLQFHLTSYFWACMVWFSRFLCNHNAFKLTDYHPFNQSVSKRFNWYFLFEVIQSAVHTNAKLQCKSGICHLIYLQTNISHFPSVQVLTLPLLTLKIFVIVYPLCFIKSSWRYIANKCIISQYICVYLSSMTYVNWIYVSLHVVDNKRE